MDSKSQHLREPAGKDPFPDRSWAPLILGLVLALLACLAWAVWDETVARRPWKAYQREYARRALEVLDREIRSEKARIRAFLESPQGKRLLAGREKVRRAFSPESPLGRKVLELEGRLRSIRKRIALLRERSREVNGRKLQLLSRGAGPESRPGTELEKELRDLERKLLEAGDREEEALAELDRIEEPLRAAERPFEEISVNLKSLEKTRGILARFTPRVEQIYLESAGRVERCLTCHMAMRDGMPGLEKPPFRKHPGDYLVHHPPSRFGCVACHEGYGTALDDLASPHGFDPSYPREILRGPAAQGRCGTCHRLLDGRDRTAMRGELPGAPALSLGLKAFERNLCFGCHVTPGFPVKSHPAPPLDQVPAKLGFERALEWVRDPGKVRKDARMPRFRWDRKGRDLYAVVSYLFSLPGRKIRPAPRPAWLAKKEDDMSDEELDRLDALLERGRKAWSRVQCADCHPREGKGGDAGVYAPDLSNAGARISRDWLYRHLEDPHALYPESRMPKIGLTEGQILGLVESILRDPEFGGGEEEEGDAGPRLPAGLPRRPSRDRAVLERGRSLVLELGCAGCHSIPGHEGDAPAGSDLSDYGDKEIKDLDFGPREDIPRTVESWTLLKLQDPRAFGGELLMPVPHLTRREALAVTAFLLGLTRKARLPVPKPSPPEPFRGGGEAWKIVREKSCLTCHSFGRRGGDYAPELSFEGSRVRPAWLKGFLERPASIRPRLVQMPQLLLSSSEVETLVRFFQFACREDALESFPAGERVKTPSPREGTALLRKYGCLACHSRGGKGGILGADIEKASERLRPGFVYHWILDPRGADKDSLCPRSGMPPRDAAALARFLTERRKG